MARVALIGTGRMGSAMARRIAAAGHDLVLWNRTVDVANTLLHSLGDDVHAAVADTASGAVVDADVVITVLSDGKATASVLLHPTLLESLPEAAVVCDMGTSGPAAARAIGEAFRATHRSFVDAPVSGSVATVDAGQLLVMASGEERDIARAEPVLASFAKQVVRTGVVGSGQVMKLAVNLVVHDLNAAISEALVLATRAGIDIEAAYDVFQASVIGAPFVQYKRAAFVTGSVPVAMSLGLSAKDLRLIVELVDELGVPARVTRAARGEVDDACRAGLGDEDMAGLFRHLAGDSTATA